MITPVRCPICSKAVSSQASAGDGAFPFCSERCRKVDFHRWCDGRYAVVEDLDPEVAEFLRDDPNISIEEGEG